MKEGRKRRGEGGGDLGQNEWRLCVTPSTVAAAAHGGKYEPAATGRGDVRAPVNLLL